MVRGPASATLTQSLLPACLCVFIAQPQGSILDEQSVHNLLKMSEIPTGRHLQQDCLVEMLGLWQLLLEEPALDWRERHLSYHLHLFAL